MLPLIPTLALAFVSFICSAFVILRIVIPILPPHPLSRRVPPSEFGLPNFKTLSPADKSHIWLASCDILALALFVWQAFAEHLGGPAGFAVASDPASAIRLWLATTLRQACLLIVASLTLLHVRLGRPVAFGSKHWMLWAPTLLLVATSTSLAGILAGTNITSFYYGLMAYSSALAVLSTIAFGCLIGTLVMIKRNLAALNDMREPWPPAQEVADKPRPSFATEDIDALKDGSSWITSRASSRQESISAFSFSTHHSRAPSNASSRHVHPALASNPSIMPKSSFWFNQANPHSGRESSVPPVPPLPAPYRTTAAAHESLHDDPDPFRRTDHLGVDQRLRLGSQSSWLSENSDQATLSAWSFPVTQPNTPAASTADLRTHLLPSSHTAVSRPHTPAMASTDVLGGYGYAPETAHAEKGARAVTTVPASDLDVSVYRTAGWLVNIWIPFALSLPFYAIVSPHSAMSPAMPILLVLSVTLSSPLLAFNILLRSPIPIPSGLFETYSEPPSVVMRAPSAMSTVNSFTHEYKRSGSVTVVEGRRSGDVWITNGDAVEGKSKLGRAVGLLSAKPKLSVLPPVRNSLQDVPLTPPLPMQTDDNMPSVPQTPQSQMSAEMGMRRIDSKASSYYSGAEESVAFATQIMIAQRHYSAVAKTLILPPSPERKDEENVDAAATGIESAAIASKRSSHLRARSITSTHSSGANSPISPPPSLPLPPTPPSVRERKAARLTHRKSYSSGFSFGAIDNTQEIDALSAGLLPLLVPGLKIGSDVKIRDSWKVSPSSVNGTRQGKNKHGSLASEMGVTSGEFSSPDMHSTPAERVAKARSRKDSRHKRHHFSLPSLSLGKDGVHALSMWRNEVNRELDTKLTATISDTRRNTMLGHEYSASQLNVVNEEDEHMRPTSPYARSPRGSDALSPPDVPEGMNTARNSLATLITALDQEWKIPPPSAASDMTLFDFDPSHDGPQAESTPHESRKANSKHSKESQAPPPVPALPSKASRRSSIVYIKSDENTAPATTIQPTTSPRRIAEWTSRVRPLIPKSKASKLRAKEKSSNTENESVRSPGGGLRPLSLLQDRDVNVQADVQPLAVGKKKQKHSDENAPTKSSPRKGLKPLKLSRSETTKQRAVLRQNETLPEVVVRPPSQFIRDEYEATAF